METAAFSKSFESVRLTKKDIPVIYKLCNENTLFYEYSKKPVSAEGIAEDLTALPPGKELCDKYNAGFYKDGKLCAILDLIAGYPNSKTAYIGLFMTAIQMQGKGIGSKIISELCDCLKAEGFTQIKLAVIKSNLEAIGFWQKNGFETCGEEIVQERYSVIPMYKTL